MASTGYLQIHAYTSSAQLPLQNVAIVITTPDQTALAMRLTDRSGLTNIIEIPVPDRAESQEPGIDDTPFTSINLYAYYPGFEQVYSENVQIFSGVTTYQDLEMIPMSEHPAGEEDIVHYFTPPQDL